MKIRIQKLYTLTAVLLLVSLLSGCGAKAAENAYVVQETAAAAAFDAGYAKEEDYAMAEMPAPMEEAYEYEAGVSGSGLTGSSLTEEELSGSNLNADGTPAGTEDHGRKLIRNVDISLQTLEFDKVTERIRKTVSELGGYIESSGTYGGNYYGSSRRNANITARIPKDKLDFFLNTALEDATVISINETTEDITLRYTDLESRVETLEIEKERLNALLLEADSIETVIALESRLSEVRYELESIQSSLKNYDNRVTYSTVWLYIEEVEIITPAKEATFGEKIRKGFAEGTGDFVDGLESFTVWFISNIFSILFTLFVIACLIALFGKVKQKAASGRKKEHGKLFAGRKKNRTAVTEEKGEAMPAEVPDKTENV